MKNLLAYSLLVGTLNGLVKRAVKTGLSVDELNLAWEAVLAQHHPKELKK